MPAGPGSRPAREAPRPEPPTFRRITILAAAALAAAVGLLLVMDLFYLLDFAARAPADVFARFWDKVCSRETGSALGLSLVSATVTTALGLAVAVPAGYALSRFRIPAKMAVDTLVDAAIILPPLIMGVSLLVLFSALGRMGAALGSVGHPHPVMQWLYDFFVYNRPGVVLAQFFVAAAFSVRAMKSAFDSADRRVEDVALSLGCTRFGAFWHAAMPQATSGLLAGAVMSWSYAMGIFAPVAIFAGTIEGRTAVLSTRTFLEVSNGNLEVALAMALIMICIAMTVLIVFKHVVARFSGSSRLGW